MNSHLRTACINLLFVIAFGLMLLSTTNVADAFLMGLIAGGELRDAIKNIWLWRHERQVKPKVLRWSKLHTPHGKVKYFSVQTNDGRVFWFPKDEAR